MSDMKGTLENWVVLDLETAGVQHRLTARQGDSLVHKIVVRLMADGRKYVPGGAELAQFYGLLADGSTVTADGRIRPDGAVEFTPGSGFFSVGGPVIVRLVIRDGGGAELYSPAFAIDTEYCFAAGAPTVPAEEYSRMEEMLLATLEAQKKCQAAAKDALDCVIPLSDTAPLMNGAATPGTSEEASRADHTHPTDTTRMPAPSEMSMISSPAAGDTLFVYSVSDKAVKKIMYGRFKSLIKDSLTSETWTFVMKDGTTVTKEVLVK